MQNPNNETRLLALIVLELVNEGDKMTVNLRSAGGLTPEEIYRILMTAAESAKDRALNSIPKSKLLLS